MDTNAIAGATSLMQTASQQKLSVAMMKQAANQQNQMANMLAQNAKQAPQPASDPQYSFSTYA